MGTAKALSEKDLNHLYEPKYKSPDKLDLFIEHINLKLCNLKNRNFLNKNKKLEFIWEISSAPTEIFDYSFEIEQAFKDAGWYSRIAKPSGRSIALVLKTIPFDETDVGSGGL